MAKESKTKYILHLSNGTTVNVDIDESDQTVLQIIHTGVWLETVNGEFVNPKEIVLVAKP